MMQKEKELLLKDLCARLPYEVKGIRTYRPIEIVTLNEIIPRCKMNPNVGNVTFCELGFDETLDCCVITEFKPYLFPLSSMTEEQKKEISKRYNLHNSYGICIEITNHSEGYWDDDNSCHLQDYLWLVDWLNENHFDYKGLIEKGLAIDATGLNIY